MIARAARRRPIPAEPGRPRKRPTRRRRRGAVLVMAAFVLVMMIGIMALTLESGSLMAERRRAQAISDSAAMAAACDLAYNFGFNTGRDPSGTASASALSAAAISGYSNDGKTSTVTVNIPPTSGNYAGIPGYAEVLVAYYQPRAFSAIFGSGALKVTARSVARGLWAPGNTDQATGSTSGLLLLEPVLPAAFVMALNGSLTVVNGAIDIDSSSILSTTLALNDRITATAINATGGGLALLNGSISATLRTGVPATLDPLAYLSPPDPSTLPVQRTSLLTISGTSTVALQPGVYNGGIRIAASANVTMAPGIYYMNGGGFTVVASALFQGQITGNGVMIVNAPILIADAISIAATGNLTITPPTTGLYAGISIMQPPELIPLPLGLGPPLTIGANSVLGYSFSLGGTVYAPQSNVVLAGNGTTQVGSQVIARTASVAANSSVTINSTISGSGIPVARTPRPVKLVE